MLEYYRKIHFHNKSADFASLIKFYLHQKKSISLHIGLFNQENWGGVFMDKNLRLMGNWKVFSSNNTKTTSAIAMLMDQGLIFNAKQITAPINIK